jgi:hypothetical protein
MSFSPILSPAKTLAATSSPWAIRQKQETVACAKGDRCGRTTRSGSRSSTVFFVLLPSAGVLVIVTYLFDARSRRGIAKSHRLMPGFLASNERNDQL